MMDFNSSIRVGDRIKKLRLEAHLTQSELADGIITRNMLSMIESGKTLPSLDTLFELCYRLGVSPGYVFADHREELMYRKDAVIDKIRTLFTRKQYTEVIHLSASLEEDDEIAFFVAFSYLWAGMEVFKTSPAQAFESYFDPACALSQNKSFHNYLVNTCELAKILWEHAGERRVSLELCNMKRFMPCAFSHELFVYLSAVRFIESGDISAADVILNSGLIVSDFYRLHLEGAVLEKRDDPEGALKAFVRASEEPTLGFYSTLLLYTDIELCAQKLGDYKLAYDYSSKHISLIESIRK